MTSHTVVRVSLVLTATGILAGTNLRHSIEASMRHSIEATPPDLAVALAYLFYLGLILLATPARPPRWAVGLGFALAAFTYLSAAAALHGNLLAMAAYAAVALGACLATTPALRPLAVSAFALWTPALPLYRGDAIPPILDLAAILALIGVWAALLDRRATTEVERLRRVGFGLLAVASVVIVFERELLVAAAGVAPDELMALVAGAGLPLLGFVRVRGSLREALATGLALTVLIFTSVALLGGKGYHVDAVTVPHHAAELLLAGRNPYTSFDLPEALARFGVEPALVTHYEDGSAVRDLNYPALSFLLVVPFVAAGLADIRWIYVAEIVLLVLVLRRFVRSPWHAFVATAVVGNVIVLRQSILAGVDPTWAVLVVLAWLAFRSPIGSPLLLGLAIASRQPAWFVAPFYLAAVWRSAGRVEALRRSAIVAVAAIVPNLAFVIDAPAAFVAGIAGPLAGPYPPDGIGLIRFALSGPLPLMPRAAYAALSLGALVLLLGAVWRYWRSLRMGAVVFPFVPLYLAWRSLQNYFGFAPLLALVADDELRAGERAESSSTSVATASAPARVSAPTT